MGSCHDGLRKVFDGDAQRLRAIFEKVCRDFQAKLVEMNDESEHLHLLIRYSPKHLVSSLVNSRKGVSSRLLCIARPGETLFEPCPVVAFLLRRQLWRGTAGHYSAIRRATKDSTLTGLISPA